MTVWHRRDPRAKTVAALVLSFTISVAPVSRTAWLLLPAAGLLLTSGLARSRVLQVVRAVLLLWLLSFAANAFLVPGDRVGPDALGWFRPTGEGLRTGFAHGARLAVLATLSAWLVATTAALDLAESLEWSLRGIPALRRAAHRALLPVVLSLKLVPWFSEEARRLLDVDRLRGGPRRGLAGARRVARLAPVWVVTVIDRAEALALALTLRGYRPESERGFSRSYRLGVLDLGLVGVSLAAAAWLGAR